MASDAYAAMVEHVRAGADPRIGAKFCDIPRYIENWTAPFGGIAGRRVLDFGCGDGLSACGVALRSQPASVLGVDINSENTALAGQLRVAAGLESLPDNLRFETIKPGEIASETDFDVVYSWSVFEHVHLGLYGAVLGGLRDRMRPGGLLFLQISPLFFSREGSHLWEAGAADFHHLTLPLHDLAQKLRGCDLPAGRADHLWSMFSTLNRVTADQLIDSVRDAGFDLLSEQRSRDPGPIPVSLLGVYREDVLRTFQIVALFRRT